MVGIGSLAVCRGPGRVRRRSAGGPVIARGFRRLPISWRLRLHLSHGVVVCPCLEIREDLVSIIDACKVLVGLLLLFGGLKPVWMLSKG